MVWGVSGLGNFTTEDYYETQSGRAHIVYADLVEKKKEKIYETDSSF